MEMSASPTALQDNPCRVKDSDGDWSTKEATQDRVKPITSTCYQRKLVLQAKNQPTIENSRNVQQPQKLVRRS